MIYTIKIVHIIILRPYTCHTIEYHSSARWCTYINIRISKNHICSIRPWWLFDIISLGMCVYIYIYLFEHLRDGHIFQLFEPGVWIGMPLPRKMHEYSIHTHTYIKYFIQYIIKSLVANNVSQGYIYKSRQNITTWKWGEYKKSATIHKRWLGFL